MSCVGIYECDELIVVSSRCRWCAAGLGSTSWRVHCCFYSRLCSGTSEISCFLLWLSLRQCSCLLMSTAIIKIRDTLRRLRHFFFTEQAQRIWVPAFQYSHSTINIREYLTFSSFKASSSLNSRQTNLWASFSLGQSCVCKCSMAGFCAIV